MSPGLYLHIPFCKSRCSYCDFATDILVKESAVDRYIHAICAEIDRFESTLEHASPDSIYLGGGTPSLLTPSQLEALLERLNQKFDISSTPEITIEINPGSADVDRFRDYRSLGVNRASFGVQTFNEDSLRLLARGHDVKDVFRTFDALTKSGFENISLDLIAGLPGQTMKEWEKNITEAVAFDIQHISLYLLEIHEGTPLKEQIRSGRRPMPDDELAAEMYEVMIDRLCTDGFLQYEISNFARPGFEARHNMKYWTCEPVHAFGVSAHSFDGKIRRANVRDTSEYVRRIEAGESPCSESTEIDLASEAAFLGLRLTSGLDREAFKKRFGVDLEMQYSAAIASARSKGLLYSDGNIRLTRKGMLFSNEVFEIFV